MKNLTKSQRGRTAIREFSIIAEALVLRGYYRPSGPTGKALARALQTLSPEIYGTMNDPRTIELKGLEYVIDRLPRGIESCTRIVLTAQEDLAGTSFEEIYPLKRRRTSFRVRENEICFVITRGLSEIYDILTHLTFLNIEAGKIRTQVQDGRGEIRSEWRFLESSLRGGTPPDDAAVLDRAIWNMSIILGRTYHETRATYEYLEKNRRETNANSGLFEIVYQLGKRMAAEEQARENMLMVTFTPSLQEMIGQQKYGRLWAARIKKRLIELGLTRRPLHVISANLHSVVNLLYGHAALQPADGQNTTDPYPFFEALKAKTDAVIAYAKGHGFYEVPDASGVHIDCQIIDTAGLAAVEFHPALTVDRERMRAGNSVLLVMDYAFGVQAGELMDELLDPLYGEESTELMQVASISVMGKAGILPGKKGDIMLATAHVFEGSAHNYIVENDLSPRDFNDSVGVYTGPIITVLGTSLQNRDVLERFQTTSWRAVGLEMEGGHYQRAISAAIVKGHVAADVRLRYAYYASDNPLLSGQTLASGSMGREGVRPTYMITRAILEKIFCADAALDAGRRD